MDLWIIYSIAGFLALGLGDYIKKLVLSQGGNKELFLLTCFSLYVPMFFINMLIQGTGNYEMELIKNAAILGFVDFLIPLSMMTTIKYLDFSFALITIRLISSLSILFIGIYVLGEQLSGFNILGFIIGVIVIFILSGFQFNKGLKIHKKGVIALVFTIIGVIASNVFFKSIVAEINIHDFMILKFSISFCCILLYIFFRKRYTDFNKKGFKKALPYALISCTLFVAHFLYFLPNMYLLGPLSLSYKILSYSLLVPIILSVIFLGEKLNKRKVFALILTIISIALFI